jgi:hypothetical protein
VRAHARELGDEALHEAETLADAKASGDLVAPTAQAIALAQRVSTALDGLQVRPGDALAAGRAAAELQRYARQARELAARP